MTLAAATIPTPTSAGQRKSLPAVTPSSSYQHVLPRITNAPSADDYPIQVAVALTTTIVIPDYPLYYDSPIFQFSPDYQALPDGSLIAAPFRLELQQDSGILLLVGVLMTIFLRNAFVSGNYLRRIKVQRTLIFRMLFVSQVVAFVGLVPKTLSFLTPHVNCQGAEIGIAIASTSSIIFIMTGVLGYKAYKCLANSNFVLLTLAILTIGAISTSLADYITVRGARRLTGSCGRVDNLRWMRIFIILQLAQSFFLCCCFLFAVWKSRRSPVARDRISVRLSMDFGECAPSEKSHLLDRWEIITRSDPEEVVVSHESHQQNPGSVVHSETPTRQSSVREASASHSLPSSRLRLRRTTQVGDGNAARPLSSGPAASLAPSTFSRISHYMPRLFRAVMKDELCYTAMITVFCAIVAIIAVVGVTSERLLWFMGWACLYWAATSIFATHSLGRAVSRHEREDILQTAALYTRRWENERARTTRTSRNMASSNSIRSSANGTSNADSENPFDDAQAIHSTYRHSVLSSLDTASPSRLPSSRSSLIIYPTPTLQFPVASGRRTSLDST